MYCHAHKTATLTPIQHTVHPQQGHPPSRLSFYLKKQKKDIWFLDTILPYWT